MEGYTASDGAADWFKQIKAARSHCVFVVLESGKYLCFGQAFLGVIPLRRTRRMFCVTKFVDFDLEGDNGRTRFCQEILQSFRLRTAHLFSSEKLRAQPVKENTKKPGVRARSKTHRNESSVGF
jgi:hypothetical protein